MSAVVGGSHRQFGIQALLALVLTLAVTVIQIVRQPIEPIEADALGYALISYDLAHHGVFGNGAWAPPHVGQAPPPGMFLPPGYPAFLAGLMKLDPVLADTIDCHMARWADKALPACQVQLGAALPVQATLMMVTAWLVWLAGWRLTASAACAWGALGLALATGRYAGFSGMLLTECLALPLFTAASLGLVEAARARQIGWLAGAGLLWGLLVLVRPGFAYAFYLALPVLAWVWWRQWPVTRIVGALALLMAGYAVAVGPWMARNAVVLGHAAVTGGYDSFILAQRLAYNAMSLREWAVSFLYWLPGPGETLAMRWLPAEDWQRLGFEHPESFFAVGNGPWRQQLFAEAGGMERATGHLLRDVLLPDLAKHLLVTVALFWRGLWIVKWWAFATVPLTAAGLVLAACRRCWPMVAFAAPTVFMAGFHAFVSVGVHRYNLILVPALSVVTAWLCADAWRRLRGAA